MVFLKCSGLSRSGIRSRDELQVYRKCGLACERGVPYGARYECTVDPLPDTAFPRLCGVGNGASARDQIDVFGGVLGTSIMIVAGGVPAFAQQTAAAPKNGM